MMSILLTVPAFCAKQGSGNKLQFEYIESPEGVPAGQDVRINFYMVNRGADGNFYSTDNILASIPKGNAVNQLTEGPVDYVPPLDNLWVCDVWDNQNEILLEIKPNGADLVMDIVQIISFEIYLSSPL